MFGTLSGRHCAEGVYETLLQFW